VCRDPAPFKPSIYRLPSTATLPSGLGQKQLLAGYPTVSHTPSLHKKPSSSSRHTPQTTPEKLKNSISIGPPPLESGSMGTGLNKGGDRRPHDRSNDPPLGQRGGLVARMPSHRSTTGSESSPMPIDPQPFDWGELQKGQVHTHNQVYGPAGGTRKSHTDLQSTSRGGRTASRRDVSGKGSSKLRIREAIFATADNGVEFDLNHDLDDNDEGNHCSGTQPDNRGASRTSHFQPSPARYLTSWWRLGSKPRQHETNRTRPRCQRSRPLSCVTSSGYTLETDDTPNRPRHTKHLSTQLKIRQIQCVFLV